MTATNPPLYLYLCSRESADWDEARDWVVAATSEEQARTLSADELGLSVTAAVPDTMLLVGTAAPGVEPGILIQHILYG